MEYFIGILCKKYKKFNNNIIVRAVKESFIYNLFKALIIIMLMLLLIFKIKPKKAYIYAELEQIETSSLDYQIKELGVSNISFNYIEINSMDKIVIDLTGLSINDIDYFSGDYLEIYPKDNLRSSISFSGTIVNAYFYDAKSNINYYGIIYSDYSAYRFIGEQYLKINDGTAYIVNTNNGKRNELDHTEDLVLISTSYRDIINEYNELIDNITENDGSISGGYENEYQNYAHIIDQFSNDKIYSVWIYAEPADSKSKDTRLESCFIDFNNINSEQVVSCRIIASGKVTISYTPTAEEYLLKNQELHLFSKDASLKISHNIENGTAFISGYVDDAILSQMDLFPNFWNWYFSNIYMVPLTLISTVLSASSMMNILRKNKQS